MAEMSFKQRVCELVQEMKAPKNLYNPFGKYNYRNAESILESVKPLLKKYQMILTVTDEIRYIGDRYYVEAKAVLEDCLSDQIIIAKASAREASERKGMDDSQITGTASSYARKYALNGLFLLDDTKDADSEENHIESEAKAEASKKAETAKANAAPDTSMLPIDAAKEATLIAKAGEKGVDLNKIFAKYKIRKLGEMTNAQFINCMKCLEKS